MNDIEKIGEEYWAKSPITGKQQVLLEYDDKNGQSEMDLSSGYYTQNYPLNHKDNPDFDISTYEQKMPAAIKALRFDDGEKYWYPTTMNTGEAMIFPVGEQIESIRWCYAKIKTLTISEKAQYSKDVDYTQKIDMDGAEYYATFIEAAKNVNGYSLGDI